MPKLQKTDAEWQAILSASQFAVLRKGSDERKGSHPLIHETGRGMYVCAACFNPLFESSAKFAHRDHPSFYEAEPGAIETQPAFGSMPNGYCCAHCGGYLGTVHNDGPQPTGKRYANNGEAILFVPRGQPLPPLRT
ncbi:MAG: peptide-methionine (R)-S-oxide reductase [Panacagrimonas sp.]